MGLIDSIREAFSSKATGSDSVGKITPTGYEISGSGYFDTTSKKKAEYLREMKGWVGAATTAIADEVASIDIKLYETKGDGNDVEEIYEHPVLDLLFKVNTFTTKFDHFWLTQSFLELTGEAPWFLERENGVITSIYFLLPDRLTPITGSSRMIEGYKYTIGPGQNVTLGVDEVIFLKYPNPAQPFRGIGTLEMAALSVDIDNFSEKWNATFYKNSARPDSILKVNTPNMTDEQKSKLKKSFEGLYQGENNAHKNMLLFGDMAFEKTGFSPKDMDFLQQQTFSRDKILGIFRVPKAIVSQTDGVNYASSKSAEYIFARYTIKPKMERLVQQLNEFLLPMFDGTENMFLDYSSPVQSDDEKDIVRYNSALQNGWMTINEVRTEQGLAPIDGGDDLQVQSNNNTTDDTGKKNTGKVLKAKRPITHSYSRIAEMKVRGKIHFKQQETRAVIKRAIKKALIADYRRKQNAQQVIKDEDGERRVLSEAEIKAYWEIKNQVYKKYLEKFQKDITKIFKAQRRSTLLKFTKADKKGIVKKGSEDMYNDIRLDEEKEVVRTLAVMMPSIEALFKEAGDETFDLLQNEAEMDVNREEIQTLLRSSARKFAVGVTETTNDFIQTAIEEGLSANETIPELRGRIVNLFDDAESFRAERIARSETARYNVRASEQAFIDSGLVEAKIWTTDPNPCEYCAVFAGKVVKIGTNYANQGDVITPEGGSPRTLDYEDIPGPPLHPNCQCDLTPVFLPVGKVIGGTKIVTVIDTEQEREYYSKKNELDSRLIELDGMEDATTDEFLEAQKIRKQLSDMRDAMIDKLNGEYEQE